MNKSAINILMLDDEAFMRKILRRMLANLDYHSVSECESGLAALALLDSQERYPDIILLDLNMPEMDGLEFVRHLVERRYNGSLILISGEDERQQQAAEKLIQAHNIEVLGQLHKPAAPEALAVLLEKWGPPQKQYVVPSVTRKIYDMDDVRAAITNNELINYYQPKVHIASGRVIGVETLVRWHHPIDGLVFPDQFIGVAEAHDLIDALTRVVMTNAFTQAKAWLDAGLTLQVAVNLSMNSLCSLDFLNDIVGLAIQTAVPPHIIKLEVTESRLMEDLRIPLEILSRLRLKRFQLSIDDFGTGTSSLAQLRDLPFDELKIDRSFVHGAEGNEKLYAMFEYSLGLAKILKMHTVAEGVENQADWDFVRKTTCDIAQGYFIAKPMLAADLPSWINTWESSFMR